MTASCTPGEVAVSGGAHSLDGVIDAIAPAVTPMRRWALRDCDQETAASRAFGRASGSAYGTGTAA